MVICRALDKEVRFLLCLPARVGGDAGLGFDDPEVGVGEYASSKSWGIAANSWECEIVPTDSWELQPIPRNSR